MMNREQALKWCVDNLEAWPTSENIRAISNPVGWSWAGNDDGVTFRLQKDSGLRVIFNNHYRVALMGEITAPASDSESVFAEGGTIPSSVAYRVSEAWKKEKAIDLGGNDHGAKNPSHYNHFGIDDIEIIAGASTVDEWRGFCRGSWMKYRLRMGAKDAIEQEMFKSNNYIELFDEYKHLCRGVR